METHHNQVLDFGIQIEDLVGPTNDEMQLDPTPPQINQPHSLTEPHEGMEFDSEESAKSFYNTYARRIGFSTRVSSSRRSRKDGAIIQRSFVCAKEGFRNINEKRTINKEIKRPRVITRVGCKASLIIKINEVTSKWIVSSFFKEHNHDLVPPDQVHSLRSHRQINGPAKALIDTLQSAGLGPRRIMSALIKECGGISEVGFTEVDCRNYMRNNKFSEKENKNRKCHVDGDLKLLLEYLGKLKEREDSSFFYEERIGNVIWVDGKSKENYEYFGDTVFFDTTFRSNKYRLPFGVFTGVNGHGQPVLFGCVFVVSESEEVFVWLFSKWLEIVGGRRPVSVTTDYDEVIRKAVVRVFPESRHRFCKWHLFKKCQERLSSVLLECVGFEADLYKCVSGVESVEEFESCWGAILDRYGLRENEWLRIVYEDRKQWVPVYLRDAFFAEDLSAQRGDSMNSYFDGYVNASTSMGQFFRLYEKAIESRNEKEVKADFETMSVAPVLKTPSPMEKQASQMYTRRIFTRFQEELVGTLTFMATKSDDEGDVIAYQVSKFGEEHKAFYVRFNVLEMRATCSCQMFEFSGILCRHVLAVFRVANVLTLPSHYILKRWTRNAKSSVILDNQQCSTASNYLESHTVRYNTLRHETFKFVEEAASSSETYDVAMAALQEAAEKVALALKNEGRGCMVNCRVTESRTVSGTRSKACSDSVASCSDQLSEDNMDQKIKELGEEIESVNQKCEVYRANLFSVLKHIEDHKQQLAVKVHNVKLSLKDTC